MEELLEQLGGDLENNPEMETKLQYEEKRVISVTRLQARTRGYLARNPKSLIFFSTTLTEGESFFWHLNRTIGISFLQVAGLYASVEKALDCGRGTFAIPAQIASAVV